MVTREAHNCDYLSLMKKPIKKWKGQFNMEFKERIKLPFQQQQKLSQLFPLINCGHLEWEDILGIIYWDGNNFLKSQAIIMIL